MKATEIVEGEVIPDFELPADGGARISRGDLAGGAYVLYLYPKDDTSGCTKESIGFAEAHGDFAAAGTRIIGLSKDSAASHDRFKARHGFPFTLASDEDCVLIAALGSWVEKSMYGRKYMGTDRSTFLVDGAGVVRKIWRKVKVPGHVDAVLAEARGLAGSSE